MVRAEGSERETIWPRQQGELVAERGGGTGGQGWRAARQLLVPRERQGAYAGCRTNTQRAEHVFSLNGFSELREKAKARRVSAKRERSE